MEQVIYYSVLFEYIMEYIPKVNLYTFFDVSKGHRDIVQEICINKYISYMKGASIFLDHNVRVVLNTITLSPSTILSIQSLIPSIISLKEPIHPLFINHVNEVCLHYMLSRGGNVSICDRALLHMDQCMYNYASRSIRNNNNQSQNDTITKILHDLISDEKISEMCMT
jgi:hypothetical protein